MKNAFFLGGIYRIKTKWNQCLSWLNQSNTTPTKRTKKTYTSIKSIGCNEEKTTQAREKLEKEEKREQKVSIATASSAQCRAGYCYYWRKSAFAC
jgi:cell shape-determining protein MreC